MRGVLLVLASVLGASCASSGSTPGSGIETPSERIVATDNQGVLRTTVAPNSRVIIPVTPSRAFAALATVYNELGVPPSINDAASGRVGNTNFWKSRKLGNVALSTYLNCGESVTGTIADNYRVYISLLSVVRPNGSGSELETALTAYAQNMEGTSSDRIPCGSTGKLEDQIQKGIIAKAAP